MPFNRAVETKTPLIEIVLSGKKHTLGLHTKKWLPRMDWNHE